MVVRSGMAFSVRMSYDIDNGVIGTAPIAQPFGLVEQLGSANYDVVGWRDLNCFYNFLLVKNYPDFYLF